MMFLEADARSYPVRVTDRLLGRYDAGLDHRRRIPLQLGHQAPVIVYLASHVEEKRTA